VERIVLPDACQLAFYMAVRLRTVVDGLEVYPDRMRENLHASHGLVFSQAVLLALVEAGWTRDDAYRAVQRAAARSWEDRRPFLDILLEDHNVVDALGPARLEVCFDLVGALAHAGRSVDALDAAESP
jgi:adenylosuccinate lyase